MLQEPSETALAWAVLVLATVLAAVLARSFFLNAKRIMGGRHRAVDRFRTDLERDANRMVDRLLESEDSARDDRGGC